MKDWVHICSYNYGHFSKSFPDKEYWQKIFLSGYFSMFWSKGFNGTVTSGTLHQYTNHYSAYSQWGETETSISPAGRENQVKGEAPLWIQREEPPGLLVSWRWKSERTDWIFWDISKAKLMYSQAGDYLWLYSVFRYIINIHFGLSHLRNWEEQVMIVCSFQVPNILNLSLSKWFVHFSIIIL